MPQNTCEVGSLQIWECGIVCLQGDCSGMFAHLETPAPWLKAVESFCVRAWPSLRKHSVYFTHLDLHLT